jgi:hypothetical protein
MSDTYATRHYHRPSVTPPGTNPRKKYLIILLAVIFAATTGLVYYAYSSGLLAEDNPNVPGQVLTRINSERAASNLPPVGFSGKLAGDAIKISRQVRVSPMGYRSGSAPANGARTSVLVIPKISWALSGYDSQQQLFAGLENDDPLFRDAVLDPAYDSVGIGVTGDSYNYYIVTVWE